MVGSLGLFGRAASPRLMFEIGGGPGLARFTIDDSAVEWRLILAQHIDHFGRQAFADHRRKQLVVTVEYLLVFVQLLFVRVAELLESFGDRIVLPLQLVFNLNSKLIDQLTLGLDQAVKNLVILRLHHRPDVIAVDAYPTEARVAAEGINPIWFIVLL